MYMRYRANYFFFLDFFEDSLNSFFVIKYVETTAAKANTRYGIFMFLNFKSTL